MSKTVSMQSYKPMMKENYKMFENKHGMRKKAMDMIMKSGPEIAMKIAKKGMSEESPVAEGEVKEEGQRGFESMMVSPEEKQMIISMRKENGGEEQAEGKEYEGLA